MGCSSCGGGIKKPTKFQQVRSFALSLANVIEHAISTGQIVADRGTVDKRIQICTQCKYREPIRNRCKACGCFLAAKSGLASETCPQGYW
jgi:hypothetical protein